MRTVFIIVCLIFQLINTESRNFYAYSYDEIVLKLEQWKSKYADIFKVYTAKEKYNIYFENENIKCSERYGSCQHHIIIITNHKTWNNNLWRPHIFFSGALHGNEQVGPSTLIELCDYLLFEYKNENKNVWINYLINNRVIILTPMTNAIGYSLSTRTETQHLDPNRDFPFMIGNPLNCMKTLTARIVNEIFREYLVQLAITFHGGMRAISYEWGTPNHNKPKDFSPDHIAQLQIATNMQILGGHSRNKGYYYPIGTLNGVVYPVSGGMEDWAYAGSWDKNNVIQCTPNSYSKYAKNKTIYNNAMLRSFNFLIEASDKKIPNDNWGGIKNNWNDIWNIDNYEYDGHIARNIRISMFLINCGMPYVMINKYPNIIPYHPIKNTFMDGTKHIRYKQKIKIINWFVSGAISLYEYDLLFAMKNSQNTENNNNIKWQLLKFKKNPMWRKNLDLKRKTNGNDKRFGQFRFTIDIETKLTTELMKQIVQKCQDTNNFITKENNIYCPIWFSIKVKVDDQWRNNRDLNTYQIIKTYPEGIKPQSHVVNARNMNGSEWNMTNNKYYVKASKWWYAVTKININIYFIYNDNETEIKTQYSQQEIPNENQNQNQHKDNYYGITSFFLCCIAIGIIIFIYYKKKTRNRRIYGDKTYQRVSTIAII